LKLKREEVLKAVRENQPCTTEDLARILGVNEKKELALLRRILADLVREGLLLKNPDYNKRKILYTLNSQS